MSKFTIVYFGYTPTGKIDKMSKDPCDEIKKACLLNQEIIRLTKIRVHVLLSADSKAQQVIAKVFEKVQLKFQKYLVHFDFFNKEMFNRCNVEQ